MLGREWILLALLISALKRESHYLSVASLLWCPCWRRHSHTRWVAGISKASCLYMQHEPDLLRRERSLRFLAGVMTQKMMRRKAGRLLMSLQNVLFTPPLPPGEKKVQRPKHALETPARFSDCFGRFVAYKQVRKCIPL